MSPKKPKFRPYIQCDLLVSVNTPDFNLATMKYNMSVCFGAFSRLYPDFFHEIAEIEDVVELRTKVRKILEENLVLTLLNEVETGMSDKGFLRAFNKMKTVLDDPKEDNDE